jgi:hypothetical protein
LAVDPCFSAEDVRRIDLDQCVRLNELLRPALPADPRGEENDTAGA